MSKYFLAVDIGASSGRHILGSYENGKIELEEVHRFFNGMDNVDGTLCWDTERLFNEILTGMKKCKEMGKVTVLDTAWDSKGRWMQVLAPCMPYIDVFMPSIDEAIELAGGETDPVKIADFFFSMGVGKVVIKLGSKGCYLREEKDAEGVIIPCYKVQAVDTTGAGDSFCAGFLTGMAKGLSFADCGKFANAVGAHCVQAMGASTGIRSYAEIQAFIEEREKN